MTDQWTQEQVDAAEPEQLVQAHRAGLLDSLINAHPAQDSAQEAVDWQDPASLNHYADRLERETVAKHGSADQGVRGDTVGVSIDDLDRMTPEEIVAHHRSGRLDHLQGGSQSGEYGD